MMTCKKWLAPAALGTLMALGFVGCGSDENTAETITPYERVAVIPGTWADVLTVADQIASYVDTTDESTALGYPTNWIVAGANPKLGEEYNTTDLLPIPAIGGKSRVVELCNSAYATKAMATGRFHGPALPCEVSVHSDGENIYIDMLNADAIFSIFFTDINDTDGVLEGVASDVKREIRGIVLAALADRSPAESHLKMGPVFDKTGMEELSFTTPYLVYKYERQDGAAFVPGDDRTLAAEIIAKLGTDIATADLNVPGLSSGSAWRSGRPEPLAIPGVQVVEACSPKYATKATKLGNEYITALPCEIAAYIDETDESNKTMVISFLNPNFMFGTMFEGAVERAYAAGDITKEEVIEYSTLAEVVFGDLRLIVDAAVQASDLNLTVQ
ncbi:DUF302 domain-containing protein [Sulfurimonas sp. HSL-1656]|uniref:DUF302 domain-containing protein n=1 Tax=Thiomicrolovo subterrani TaxID=3131934 RepID=UPI0031F76414